MGAREQTRGPVASPHDFTIRLPTPLAHPAPFHPQVNSRPPSVTLSAPSSPCPPSRSAQLLVFNILSHFNHYDGLHIAGDWTQDVGQDAAVRSGLRAACAVGLSEQTKAQLLAMNLDYEAVAAC